MIVNGVLILKDKNKSIIVEILKIIKKGNGNENVKRASGLSNVKKYGTGLKILK